MLLETLWALKSVYEYSREDVLSAVESMLFLPVIEFEKIDAVQEFIRAGKTAKIGLDDLFIGLCAKHSGAEATLTLDTKASKSALFKLLK